MGDKNRIIKFIKLVEEMFYKEFPFSTIEHVENEEKQYVMFKVVLIYKGNVCRCTYHVIYSDIYDTVLSLEEIANFTVNGLGRRMLDIVKEIQSEEE